MNRHAFERARDFRSGLGPTAGRAAAVCLLALALAAGAAGIARAQGGIWTQFSVQGIDVSAIALTDSGSVLVGGGSGAFVYDGIHLDRLPIDALASESLNTNAILEAGNGDIWVGTLAGLFRLDRTGTVRRFTTADGLGNSSVDEVVALAETPDGRVWAGTNGGGLSVYDGTSWSSFTTDQALPTMSVADVCVDPRDGSVWAACLGFPGGLAHVVGATVTAYSGVAAGADNMRSVLVTRGGEVWIGYDHGIARLEGSGFVTTSILSLDVRSLAEGAHGEIWCGSGSRGVAIYDHGVLSVLPVGAAGASVDELVVARSGVLWLGTASGLVRFEGAAWTTHRGGDPLPVGSTVFSVVRDRSAAARGDSIDANGVTWFGMNVTPDPPQVSLGRRANARLSYLGPADGLPSGSIRALSAAANGGVWAGIQQSAISGSVAFVASNGQIGPILGLADGLPDGPVTALRAQGAGVWIGTTQGVALYDGAIVRRLPVAANRVPNAPIVGFDTDAAGRLWIATGANARDPGDLRAPAGAVIFDPSDSSYTRISVADGLPTDRLHAVRVFSNGDVWIATHAGLTRWQNGSLTTYGAASGLPSNVVNDVGEGPDGTVWAATSGGLALFDGTIFSTFTTADGLAANSIAAMAADSLGVIAACTVDGVSLFHPDRTPPRARVLVGPPPVTGNAQPSFVVTGGDPETSARELRLAHQFDSGPGSTFATDVNAITPAVPLTDGDHVLRLWAKDRSLNESAEPFVVNFTVDATAPRPILVKPAFSDVVRGIVPVVASIADVRFARYTVEIRAAGVVPWDTLLVSTELPSPPDTVFRWDTTQKLDGGWELRVGVLDNLGLQGYATVSVIVDNLAPNASVTSPARIDHVQGGRVFTTNGEAELYIPPNAWPADQIVSIDPLVPLDTLIARNWIAAWRVQANDMTLDKRGTLTLRRIFGVEPLTADAANVSATGALEPAAPRMSVVRVLADGTLVPVGGSTSPDGQIVTTTIDSLGSFALLASSDAPGNATTFDGVRGLDCQPRVVSPQGGGFDTRVAISFELGKATTAAVKVFDRAGRLVKEISENDGFSQGRNVVFWDGRDGDGSFVPSGLYMVAVRAEGETAVKTVAVANR